MAVNPQKFLPSKETTKETINIKRTSIVLSQSSVKNIATIKVKVIQIESILKGTLALEKKALDQKKRKESAGRREKQEEKLETKTNMGMGRVKMPSRPKLGIFDWIKNFIGNIILGYFAVRLVDHLPKIMPIVKLLGKAGDLIVDFGGKLLNGLATFIDWGYKAVDFSRGLVGKAFGDDALKNLDKLTSEFEKFMNLAIIVGMASADFGMDRLGRKLAGKGAERAAEKGAGALARRGAGRIATRLGARVAGKGGAKLASKVGSKALQAIPYLGAGLAIVEGIMRIREGDVVGGLLSFGTAIPVAGWAFLALDIAREFMGGQEFDKSVGRALSGKPGLTNKQVQKRTPHFFGPDPVVGAAGGGPTRGGKSKGTVKRTIGKTKKAKYKRVIPQKPGKVEITSPGADVGGEDKIFGIFPNPLKGAQKVIDAMNPFNTLKKSGEELGKTDYFGPILAITSKLLAGQKPSQQDYQNVGLGINMLIAKGIQDKQLKGGVVAAFAEGGMVDPDVLSAAETGGDISNWVAKTFQGEIESNAQRTLRLIKENAEKKKYEEGQEKKGPEAGGGGGTAGEFSPSGLQGDIYKYLLSKGMDDFHALGIMANIHRESGFKPGVSEYGGPGVGLFQYSSGGRKEAFLKAVPDYKTNWKGQIDFALKDDVGPQYLTTKFNSSQDAADWWMRKWERPREDIQNVTGPKIHREYLASLEKYRTGKGYKIPTSADFAGMDKGGVGGSIAEYITGDPNTSFGRYDPKGHGTTSNYHDHIGFRDRKTAERAYNFFKSKGIQVTEFQGYNPVGGHSSGSLHYSGLAFDIPGAQWGGSGAIGSREYQGSARVRATLKQFLGDGGLVKLAKGGRIGGPTRALLGERGGPEYVLDPDTTRGLDSLAPGLIEKLNMAKTKPQLANILQSYASYESGAEQTVVVVEDSTPTTSMGGGYGDSGAVMMMGGSGGESDPFESLAIGG